MCVRFSTENSVPSPKLKSMEYWAPEVELID